VNATNVATRPLIGADGVEEILAIMVRAVDGSITNNSKGWLPAGQAKCEVCGFDEWTPFSLQQCDRLLYIDALDSDRVYCFELQMTMRTMGLTNENYGLNADLRVALHSSATNIPKKYFR
jgi:hypothetical protein